MRKTILTAAATAAALAAAIAVTAVATATTTTKAERFSLLDASTSATPAFNAIASGAFTAGGKAVFGPVKGSFTMHFPGGTIAVKVNGPGNKGGTKVDTATACLQHTSGRGTAVITGGTGVYKGISGSGKATKNLTFVENAVKGKCDSDYSAVQGIITLNAQVSLP